MDININNARYEYLYKDDMQTLLSKFRNTVQDILEPHHHDVFLYRWLKARDFDIPKAEKMIRESFKFRKKIGADTILTSAYTLPEVFVKHQGVTRRLGFDRENSPVRTFMIGLCDCKGFLNSLTIPEITRLFIYFLETDLDVLERMGTPEAKITFILDCTGLSLKNFYHKSVISCGINILSMYQDNYPETIKVAFLLNIPTYFNWIFGMFKPFINPVTMSKLRIFKENEHREQLRNAIDPKLIPSFMGGDLTDPDGNPKCETLIDWKPKVDSCYYLKHKKQCILDDPYMQIKVIPARSVFQVPIQIRIAGWTIKWKFTTKDYNISFGVFFKDDNNQTNLEEILPVEVIDCQIIPEDNEIVCERTGTYVLHFDNTYSWLTSKQIWYKVEVVKSNVIQTS